VRTSLQDQHRTALELLRRLVIFFERFWSVGIIVGTLCCYGLLAIALPQAANLGKLFILSDIRRQIVPLSYGAQPCKNAVN